MLWLLVLSVLGLLVGFQALLRGEPNIATSCLWGHVDAKRGIVLFVELGLRRFSNGPLPLPLSSNPLFFLVQEALKLQDSYFQVFKVFPFCKLAVRPAMDRKFDHCENQR